MIYYIKITENKKIYYAIIDFYDYIFIIIIKILKLNNIILVKNPSINIYFSNY